MKVGSPDTELDTLRAALARRTALAADLVASLPTCDECDRPATRAWGRGCARYCDDHDGEGLVPEYPRAAPLRALLADLPPVDLAAAARRHDGKR